MIAAIPRHLFVPRWWCWSDAGSRFNSDTWKLCDGPAEEDNWARAAYSDRSLVTRVGGRHADHAGPHDRPGPDYQPGLGEQFAAVREADGDQVSVGRYPVLNVEGSQLGLRLPLLRLRTLSTTLGTVALLCLRQRVVLGNQGTLGVAYLVGDLPQLLRQRACAVLDAGDHAAGPADGPTKFGLREAQLPCDMWPGAHQDNAATSPVPPDQPATSPVMAVNLRGVTTSDDSPGARCRQCLASL